MSATIVTIRNLSKMYGQPGSDVRVHALRNISIDFEQGEYVAVCGQSGSGKSTLMNLLGCLDRPSSGRYLLGGVDVSSLTDDQLSDIRSRRIGFVFQNFNLVPQLTVLENLEIPLFYQGSPAAIRRRKAAELAALVGLADRSHHRPTELSGGQQQRAAIARSLINDPLIILADEPTGNLDSATGNMILGLFDELNRQGKTIIMVTHEPTIAEHCTRTITLRDGMVLSDVHNTQRRQTNPSLAAK